MPYAGRLTRKQADDIAKRARKSAARDRNHGPAVSLQTNRIHGGEFGAQHGPPPPMGSFVVPVEEQHRWTDLEQRVLAWWLTASDKREPQHWEDLCRAVGYTQDAIETWMLDERVEREYRRRVEVRVRYRRHEVHEAMHTTATNQEDPQKVKAQRLALERYGEIREQGRTGLHEAVAAGAAAGAAAAIGAQAMKDLVHEMRQSERVAKAVEVEREILESEGLDATIERPLLGKEEAA